MDQGHLTIELSESQSDALQAWAEHVSWEPGSEHRAHISVSFTISPSGKAVLEFDRNIQPLVEHLRSQDESVREGAQNELEYLQSFSDIPIVDEIAPLLDDKESFVRLAAVSLLAGYGEQLDEQVIKSVISLLEDDDENIREEATGCLEFQLGWISASALREILLMLRLEKASPYAQRLLDESCGSVGEGVACELADMAAAEDEEMQQTVARFLSAIGHEELITFYLPRVANP